MVKLAAALRWLTVRFAIALLSIEISLRIAFALLMREPAYALHGTSFGRNFSEHMMEVHNQHSGYWNFQPSQQLRMWNVKGDTYFASINRLGFRGRDWADAPAPGTLRVVTLGSSSTFGFHARDGETYPELMEKELQALCPAQKVEVLNLGVPYLRTPNEIALYSMLARSLHPRAVTLYEGGNDMCGSIESPMFSRLEPISKRVFALWLANRFLMRKPFSDMTPAESADHEKRITEAFIANIGRIRQLVEADGAVFFPATQQLKSLLIDSAEMANVSYEQEVQRIEARAAAGVAPDYQQACMLAHSRLMTVLRTWTAAEKLHLVDGIEAIDGHRDLMLSWIHLSGAANQLLAQAFAREIATEFCR